MSSEQIDVVVVIVPKAEHVEKVAGLLADVCAYVEENEPRTLRYQCLRSKNGQTGLEELIMVETYADEAAQEFHRTSEPFKELFAAIQAGSLVREDSPVALKISKVAAGFAHRL